MEPFVERPVTDLIGGGQLLQRFPRLPLPAEPGQQQDPEAAGEGPAAAVVVLEGIILPVPLHVAAPEGVLLFDRPPHYPHWPGAVDRLRLDSLGNLYLARIVGQAEESGEKVAEDIILLPPKGEINEAEIEWAGFRPVADEMGEEACPPLFGNAVAEGMKEKLA